MKFLAWLKQSVSARRATMICISRASNKVAARLIVGADEILPTKRGRCACLHWGGSSGGARWNHATLVCEPAGQGVSDGTLFRLHQIDDPLRVHTCCSMFRQVVCIHELHGNMTACNVAMYTASPSSQASADSLHRRGHPSSLSDVLHEPQ
jgi:hypothetical protein